MIPGAVYDLCTASARRAGFLLVCEAIRGHSGPHIARMPQTGTPGQPMFWGRGLKAAS